MNTSVGLVAIGFGIFALWLAITGRLEAVISALVGSVKGTGVAPQPAAFTTPQTPMFRGAGASAMWEPSWQGPQISPLPFPSAPGWTGPNISPLPN